MLTVLRRIDKMIFSSFIEEYYDFLDRELDGQIESLLDIGCGDSSKMKRFAQRLKYSVGVDNFEPRLLQGASASVYHEYKKMNILDIGEHFPQRSFDCVMALDVIEHLKKEDGYRLLEMMERIARKKVIIFTPNGFLRQEAYDGNPFQVHLSGWDVDEMRRRGYRIVGINGIKFLRGDRTNIKWRPQPLWFRVSLLTQLLVRQRPQWAFQILCVKNLGT
ncbi:MAG TPA: methyltransferase domain-containing protein [Bacteroidota bacterium]|nr:methyltransferase domain-containing protein [Bacteroidota bacterium]